MSVINVITRGIVSEIPQENQLTPTGDINKGSALTIQEHDQNLINIRSAINKTFAIAIALG